MTRNKGLFACIRTGGGIWKTIGMGSSPCYRFGAQSVFDRISPCIIFPLEARGVLQDEVEFVQLIQECELAVLDDERESIPLLSLTSKRKSS